MIKFGIDAACDPRSPHRRYFPAIVWDEVPITFEARVADTEPWTQYPSGLPLAPHAGFDVQALRYSGNGDGVTGTLRNVSSGCTADAYADAGFSTGDVALVSDELPVSLILRAYF